MASTGKIPSSLRRCVARRAALAVFIVSGWSAPAHAQLYLETRGGATLLANADIEGPGAPRIGSEIDFKTGFTASGVVGYDLAGLGKSGALDRFRLEVEGIFGKSNFDSVADEPDGAAGSLSGDGGGMTIQAGLVNLIYDVPVSSRLGGLTPYLGGGLGGAKIDVDGGKPNSPDGIDDSEAVFVYQVRTGVGYALAPRWTLSAGYRYLATPDDIRLKARGIDRFETEYRSHSFELGLRYNLY